ncbi:hypothetical protein D8674_019595 [Pyrus ussuriensis x Pyrus communis]|uniref:Uncharacterized protein n=1 Tax=Pyrus ussuriensis x Pyrus communis TaxID=2448454 RepID=A0A5N5G887_9ROSA|nr:hypothetical protein D8674_019595 [Pyrus ussuriensis x Pyrus communis]
MSSSNKITLKCLDNESFEVEEYMIEDNCADNSMSTPPSPTRRSSRTISRPRIKIWFDSRLQASSCLISSGTATGGGGSALLVWDIEALQEDDWDEDVQEEGGGPVLDDLES